MDDFKPFYLLILLPLSVILFYFSFKTIFFKDSQNEVFTKAQMKYGDLIGYNISCTEKAESLNLNVVNNLCCSGCKQVAYQYAELVMKTQTFILSS
jgi:hypothetical protein